MTKYKQYFEKMLTENKVLFDDFRKLHAEYTNSPDNLQERFNKEGGKILEVVREYENRLCSNTERGMYNKFSANLAEKFQQEVRKSFPMIDHIGLRLETSLKSSSDKFEIKKIDLGKFH